MSACSLLGGVGGELGACRRRAVHVTNRVFFWGHPAHEVSKSFTLALLTFRQDTDGMLSSVGMIASRCPSLLLAERQEGLVLFASLVTIRGHVGHGTHVLVHRDFASTELLAKVQQFALFWDKLCVVVDRLTIIDGPSPRLGSCSPFYGSLHREPPPSWLWLDGKAFSFRRVVTQMSPHQSLERARHQ